MQVVRNSIVRSTQYVVQNKNFTQIFLYGDTHGLIVSRKKKMIAMCKKEIKQRQKRFSLAAIDNVNYILISSVITKAEDV